jgi:hypothetical protein
MRKLESYSNYTHRPFLKEQLDKLKDNAVVLELGVGDGSSSLMKEYCESSDKHKVLAFDTDRNWYNSMKKEYAVENYGFNFLNSWNDILEYLPYDSYDLVFVDQAPWEARIDCINLLKDKTSVFVVHDYDYYNYVNGSEGVDYYGCDEKSWWGQTYSNEFTLIGHCEDASIDNPPTLVMEKITVK